MKENHSTADPFEEFRKKQREREKEQKGGARNEEEGNEEREEDQERRAPEDLEGTEESFVEFVKKETETEGTPDGFWSHRVDISKEEKDNEETSRSGNRPEGFSTHKYILEDESDTSSHNAGESND